MKSAYVCVIGNCYSLSHMHRRLNAYRLRSGELAYHAKQLSHGSIRVVDPYQCSLNGMFKDEITTYEHHRTTCII